MTKKDNDIAKPGHLTKGPLLLPKTPKRSQKVADKIKSRRAIDSVKVVLDWGRKP